MVRTLLITGVASLTLTACGNPQAWQNFHQAAMQYQAIEAREQREFENSMKNMPAAPRHTNCYA